MNNDRAARAAAKVLSVLAPFLACLAASYFLAYILTLVASSIMGHPAPHRLTPSFLVMVVLIWLLLLALIKTGRLQWTRVAVLSVTLLAVLIGCGALAGAFTRLLYFTLGIDSAEPPVWGLVLNGALFLLLLLSVRYYLKHGNFAKHIDAFAAAIQVMGSIAKGDYQARLEGNFKGNESFGQLAKSVNNMAADLERLENMRQEFISNVSHEIRSPLASIQGFAQVLQQDDSLGAEERKLYLSIMEAESARLSKLSDNLLQLAVLESEGMQLEPRPYRLDMQIQDLILACEPQWRGKKIGMEAFLEEASFAGDEDRMSQVWINLLHNSIKFTPEGGKIRVDLRLRGETIDVRIADTGIGIAEEDQQRIFERFYKADPSRDRSNQGSGLGLSIVGKIVGLHGGRIRVESQPGEGAAFIVTLPATH